MASCQLADVEDAGRVCTVHEQIAPCALKGHPASPYPVHVFAWPDRARQVETARAVMAGTRPILVHDGADTDPGHNITPRQSGCWCDFVIIPSG